MAQGNSHPGIVGSVGSFNLALGTTPSPFSVTGLAPGANGTVLTSTGVSSAPVFSALPSSVLTVTGTPNQITSSGTTAITLSIPSVWIGPGSVASTTSLTAGNQFTVTTGAITFTPLSTSGLVVNASSGVISTLATTNHAVQIGNASNQLTSLAVGTNGQILVGSTAADPSFITPTVGTGLSLTTNATTLNYALSVPVSIANGGSNATSMATSNGTVYYDGTRLVTTATGTATFVLTSNGTSAPTYQAIPASVTSLSGTANQISVSGSTGSVTLSLPSTILTPGNLETKGPNPQADVLAYGADPTGVADSTTAINNAIAAIPTGGIVWFPSGTYKITTTITVTTPHIRFVGQSRTDSILSTNSATADMLLFNQWYCGVENMTLTSSVTRTAGYAVNMAATYNYNYIWHTDFTNQFHGVFIGGQTCWIDDLNNRLWGSGGSGANGIYLTGSFDRYINRYQTDNVSNPTNGSGIFIDQTASLILTSANIIHAGTALNISPATGKVAPSIYASNCFFDTSVYGAQFGGLGTIQRVKFVNCWFSSHTTDGVFFNNVNTQGVDFVNCEFYQNQNGINCTAATDWSVTNSRIAGNTVTGIRTTAAAGLGFRIQNNTIGNTSGFGNNALGINIQAGTYNYYIIKYNSGLANNTTPGITDSGSVTGQGQKDIGNNIGSTLEGQISAIVAASAGINTAETAIGGGLNSAPIPANSIQIGDTFRITIHGTCTATVANASTFRIRIGTAGTTADGVAVSGAVASAASGTTIGFKTEIIFTIRTIGASATCAGYVNVLNTGITGISTNNSNVIAATTTAFSTATANYITVTYQTAAATTTSTFQVVVIEKL